MISSPSPRCSRLSRFITVSLPESVKEGFKNLPTNGRMGEWTN